MTDRLTPQRETESTLPAWLYQRFNRVAQPWESLSDADRSYWEHEAEAVQRAVARGGFKSDAGRDRRRRIYIDGKGDGWIDLAVDPESGERELTGITNPWKIAAADEVRSDTGSLREIGRCW